MKSKELSTLRKPLTLLGRNACLDELRSCMLLAPVDDGLVVFEALADGLQDRLLADCATVMTDMLRSSEYCLKAIQSRPAFFLNTRQGKSGFDDTPQQRAANAFHILAAMDRSIEIPHEQACNVIQALKKIGLEDVQDAVGGMTCLHVAAWGRQPAAFQAFMEEFPQNLEIKDRGGRVPLHIAAGTERPGNVQLMLAAGLDPRPLCSKSLTPLDYAAVNEQRLNAMMLLETGAYEDADVERACNGLHGTTSVSNGANDLATELKAYHAALKARKVIEFALSMDPTTIQHLQ